MSQTTPAATLDHLARLATRPGVQSTLILSRIDGSIIHKAGLLAQSSTSRDTTDPDRDVNLSVNKEDSTLAVDGVTRDKGAESMAHKVFSFMSQAQAFAEGVDSADEVKLLRLRTRKNEVVIVPDSKFLLVVIHDAPQT
ncbi:hypothetical protein G7Y79_00048g084020 [Physcia stellaris]|nr:hypothetical protein G7Y79_00048g084020 [Physcia stellaris]